jgi:hypothetical protein
MFFIGYQVPWVRAEKFTLILRFVTNCTWQTPYYNYYTYLNNLKTKFNLNYTYNFSSYRAVNTFPLGYEGQSLKNA